MKKPHVELYRERNCPYCRAVHIYIMIPLNRKGILRYDEINVDYGGTRPYDRWESICRRIGGPVTPIVFAEKYEWDDDYIFFLKKGRSTNEELDRMYGNLRYLCEKGEKKFEEMMKSGGIQARTKTRVRSEQGEGQTHAKKL